MEAQFQAVLELFTSETSAWLDRVLLCGVMIFSFVDHVYHGNIRSPFA